MSDTVLTCLKNEFLPRNVVSQAAIQPCNSTVSYCPQRSNTAQGTQHTALLWKKMSQWAALLYCMPRSSWAGKRKMRTRSFLPDTERYRLGNEDSMESRRKESLKCLRKQWVVRQLHRTGVQMQNATFYPQLTHQTSVLQLLVTSILFSPA